MRYSSKLHCYLNSLQNGEFGMHFCHQYSVLTSSKSILPKNSFKNRYHQIIIHFDPDEVLHFVRPHRLQRLSADRVNTTRYKSYWVILHAILLSAELFQNHLF